MMIAQRWQKVPRWAQHLIAAGLLAASSWAFLGVAGSLPQCPDFHIHAQLTGDAAELQGYVDSACSSLRAADVDRSLYLDFGLALLYGLSLSLALSMWWPLGWRTKGFREQGYAIRFLPIAAAAFDWVENLVLLATIEQAPGGGGLLVESGVSWVPMLAWPKWWFVVASVIGVALALLGWAGFHFAGKGLKDYLGGFRLLAPSSDAETETPSPTVRTVEPDLYEFGGPTPAGESIGVCLSGGGIRSAGFSLGALQALDEERVLERTRWITSVSGGGYAASAWYIAGGPSNAQILDPDREDPNLFRYICTNRRYLATGRGGLAATLFMVLRLLAINLVLLGTMVYLVAYPFGRLVSSFAVMPQIQAGESLAFSDIPARLWTPGALFVVIGGLFGLASLVLWDPKRKSLTRIASLLAAIGVALGILLALLPWALASTPDLLKIVGELLPGDGAERKSGTTLLSVLSALGVTGALVRIATKPLGKMAPRLGGVLLGVGIVLLGARVALGAARGVNPWSFGHGWKWYLLAAVVFSLLYFYLDAQRWSLNKMYEARLRTTFATTTNPDEAVAAAPSEGGVYPLRRDREPLWNEYGSAIPELIICAAAHRREDSVTGVPAVSFTFSPREIGFHATHLEDGELVVTRAMAPTERYVASLRPKYATVSVAAAMSGAAFTSAMGRHSLGTTNALLAALNVRLGLWMPNPKSMLDPDSRPGVKRPRLSYLVKEILGHYDIDNDPYVYVTDGGHWENLGLVELIRRRCPVIFCIDASGDPIGSFTTLGEAIQLASLECNAEIEILFDDLRPDEATGLSKSNVVQGTIDYPTVAGHAGFTGTLFYVKAGVARGSALAIRSFGVRSRAFPRYSTGDQFLTNDEFTHLARLGYEATQVAIHTYLGDTDDPPLSPDPT
jgi:hypothetical protein